MISLEKAMQNPKWLLESQPGGVSHTRNPFKCQNTTIAIPTFPEAKKKKKGSAIKWQLDTSSRWSLFLNLPDWHSVEKNKLEWDFCD